MRTVYVRKGMEGMEGMERKGRIYPMAKAGSHRLPAGLIT